MVYEVTVIETDCLSPSGIRLDAPVKLKRIIIGWTGFMSQDGFYLGGCHNASWQPADVLLKATGG